MKKIAVLGSTGSIGTQALDVIRAHPDKLKVFSLVAFSNGHKLAEQAAQFSPSYTALIAEQGADCLIKAVQGCDVALVATRGITALSCVVYCLQHGIDVALANKEVLVCAGQLVMSLVGKAKLYPVDSEHSAIWQCLNTNPHSHLDKILLTASGGPFWDLPKQALANVTAAQALRHPNWNMGSKITVDSATMMNKALEVIEAHWLFNTPAERIQIVVHRQSIVHSMVQWQSGSVIAQLAMPDMRLPIQLALLGESHAVIPTLDFSTLQTLTFQPADLDKFPCAGLGHQIFSYPPLAATVMNAANDVCVDAFLQGKLSFDGFYGTITSVVNHFAEQLANLPVTVQNITMWDQTSRTYTQNLLGMR